MILGWLILVALLASCASMSAPEVLEEGGLEAVAASELFFSEYIEGGSNNKALEIYNDTGAAVDLGAGVYNVFMSFNGGTSTLTINLTGTVSTGDVFVLAQASANPAILSVADQTNGSGWYNGDDAVVLRKGTTILDVIGQIGFDPGTEWGSGLTSTADNTLRRKASVCIGDTNGTDAFDPALEWDGFATDTFDGLGSHTATCGGPVQDVPPTVSSTNPADNATGVALDSNLTITFSEPVTLEESGVSLVCSGESDEFAITPSEDATAYTLDPAADFAKGEECDVSIEASAVTDQDEDGEPDPLAEPYSFSFTTLGAVTLISAVQGSTDTSPLVNQTVTVEGVVVGDYEYPGSGRTEDYLRGFYVQEEATDWDDDPTTSEGVFVFNGSNNSVSVGDTVSVTGEVKETFGQTEISASSIEILGSGAEVEPLELTMPFPEAVDGAPYLERFEGMLVTLSQDLVISEYFNFDRFGEIVLALPLDGLDRHYTPTAIVEPGSVTELYGEYLLNRITLDDTLTAQNPFPAIHPDGSEFSVTNSFRGGDTLKSATGILAFGFNLYRIQPTEYGVHTERNPRTADHEPVLGALEVASFNVLNYFTTLDSGPDVCGPSRNQECRGADNTQELERQQAKILAALEAIEADVFGLIEIENTAGVSGEADLAAGLNAELGAGTYAHIETGTIGTDAIKVALIYKPEVVTPIGDYAVLDSSVDSRFDDSRNRPALAQTFMENATGARFTVVVNHLKSKGSPCDGDPDTGDGAGNCNVTRTQAAQALADWLATDPIGQEDADALIIGDLNSYDKEDPIDALLEAGYTDLLFKYEGEYAYTYVFDGQFGYLDYALSNDSLTGQITGATAWHINADEPDILDYDTQFNNPVYYEDDPYRSSDHDPVIVGADLTYTAAETLEALRYFIARYQGDGSLSQAQADGLLGKLAASERALARGQTRVALNQVRAFENQVKGFIRSGVLSAEEGERLLRLVTSLRDIL